MQGKLCPPTRRQLQYWPRADALMRCSVLSITGVLNKIRSLREWIPHRLLEYIIFRLSCVG